MFRVQRVLFSFVFCLSIVWPNRQSILLAQQIDFPRSFNELVEGYEQFAYRVKSEAILIDYRALRRDFPPLRNLSNSRIKELVEIWGGIVTQRQLILRGFLTTDYQILPGLGKVIQPPGYHRAGVVIAFLNGKEIGLLDLKGIGLAPPGAYGSRAELDFVQSMRQFLDEKIFKPDDETYQILETIKLSYSEEVSRLIDTIKAIKENVTPENLRHHLLGLDSLKKKIETIEAMQRFTKNPSSVNRENAMQLIRSHDYTNGGISLGRAIREMTVQKITQRLFDEYNAKFGTSYGTVDTYFVVKPAYQIWVNGELVDAAVVGRQASLRMDHQQEPPILPPGLVGSGLGGLQFTGQGDLVDFELVASSEPRLFGLLTWKDTPTLHQPIDTVVDAAYNSYKRGDPQALQKFYKHHVGLVKPSLTASVLNKLKRAPKVRPTSFYIPDPLRQETWKFIRESLQEDDPDLFRYFDILRRLSANPNARVLTAHFLAKGARHWPQPVSDFAAQWIAGPTYGYENPTILMGLIQELRRIKRNDLAMNVIYFLRNKYLPSTLNPFLKSIFAMRTNERIERNVFLRAVVEIPKKNVIYVDDVELEWVDLMILEALEDEKDPKILSEKLVLAFNLIEGITRKDSSGNSVSRLKNDQDIAAFEYPLIAALQNGHWTQGSVALLNRMNPTSRAKVIRACAEDIQRLPVP